MPSGLLEVRGVSAGYGQVKVLKDLTLSVAEGSITALLGANGAGKTTLMRVISGIITATAGDLVFDGDSIGRLPSSERVNRGISLIPEGRLIFPEFSVEENLKVGAYIERVRGRQAELARQMLDLFPRLNERRRQAGQTLSGGEQQMLAIGRALMSNPKVLLLDEPTMGLSPVLVQEMARIIRGIHARGVPVVLVEQNAELALRLADYAYVLEIGSVALHGPAADLHANDHVRRAYLGA